MRSELRPQQLDREIVTIGKMLVNHLFVLIKTAQNYNEGHAAINTPAANILKAVSELHRRNEEASLIIKSGYLLIGEQHLKPDAAGFDAFMFTLGEMKRYFIGSLNFTLGITAAEISMLAYIFKEVEPVPSPQTFQKFAEKMHQRAIIHVEVGSLGEESEERGELDDSVLKDSKTRSKKIYYTTVHAVSEVMDNAKMGQTLRLRKSKRIVQSMIDQLLSAETNLIGLTTIRSHDEYTYNHSVNVCILALAIGQRIGLSKTKLCELGMAALFHDIGKSDIPLEILNKPGQFTSTEWETMERHPLLGVKKLMKLKGLDTLSARIITGAFEHHLNCDFSGYPKVPYRRLSLFGRIISIADCYDGLTSSRVYSPVPQPPDQALKYMLAKAGKAYDSILMKIFVNCVGIYPIGTLLLLNTKELAVVMGNNPDPEKWNVPRVRLITDQEGNEIDSGRIVDLADPHNARAILKTLDHNRYKIDLSRYLV